MTNPLYQFNQHVATEVNALNAAGLHTSAEYREIKHRLGILDIWINTQRKKTKCRACKGTGSARYWMASSHDAFKANRCPKCEGKGYVLGWASYKPEDKPANVPDVTNDERGKVEVYEFVSNPPNRYFAYVHLSDNGRTFGYVSTWNGDSLGEITWLGGPYRVQGFGAFPSTRQNMRVKGINGRIYSAVYYRSSGDYCRMKAFSNSNEVTK